MKVIFQFDPREDEYEYRNHLAANRNARAIEEVFTHIRAQHKYNELGRDVNEALERVKEILVEFTSPDLDL